jgi:hypothetical protein
MPNSVPVPMFYHPENIDSSLNIPHYGLVKNIKRSAAAVDL